MPFGYTTVSATVVTSALLLVRMVLAASGASPRKSAVAHNANFCVLWPKRLNIQTQASLCNSARTKGLVKRLGKHQTKTELAVNGCRGRK